MALSRKTNLSTGGTRAAGFGTLFRCQFELTLAHVLASTVVDSTTVDSAFDVLVSIFHIVINYSNSSSNIRKFGALILTGDISKKK